MIYLILAILCSAGVSIFIACERRNTVRGHYGILLMNYVVCVLAGLILHRAGADADRRKRDAGDVSCFGVVTRTSITVAPLFCFSGMSEKRGHSFIYFYETWRHRSGCFGGRLVWRTPRVEPGTWFYPCDYSDFDDPS